MIFLLWLAVKAGSITEKFKLVNKLESSIDKIKDDMSIIKAFIEIDNRNNNPFSQRNSPISLNEVGLKVSEQLLSNQIIEKSWDKIADEVSRYLNKQEDKNPYTIQEACFDIGKEYSKYFSNLDMDMIKIFAFKEGYNLSDFDLLFGIEIRNKYFQENGIRIEEIDQHDPQKD